MSKGDWEVRPYKASVFGNQATLACFEVWAGQRRIASTINEANAYLIASAPDMYEALKKIRSMTPETIIYQIANDALAKADNK